MTSPYRNFASKVHTYSNGILYAGETDALGHQNGYGVALSASGDEIIECYFEGSKMEGLGRTL